MAKKDIISKYQVEIDNIDKQIITLGDVKTAIQSNINQLISPTAQLDEQIAQLTVDINKKIYELTAISSSAIACGCGTYITDENNNEISAVGIAITTTIANGVFDQFSDTIITGINTTSILVGDIVTAVGTASTYVTAGTNVSGIGASIILLNQSINSPVNSGTISFVFTRTTDYGNRIYYYEQAKAHRMNIEDTTYTDTNPFGKLNKTDGSVAFTSGIGSNTIVVGADQNSILELIVSNPGSGFISSAYYGRTLVGGAGTGAKADIVVSAGGSVSSVIINNGGTGYAINNILTISSFAGATFTVTNVGSPILGIGVDTYIVASSGIGSEFIPNIDSTETSSCPTSCASYATQVDTLKADIDTLRSQRDAIMVGSNSIKVETKKSYVQRYSYNFAEAELNKRKTEIDAVRFVLNNPTYNQYFS